MRIVILTGAGISAESGLGTFRDKGGLWDEFDLSEVATPEGFARDPAKVLDFYNLRRRRTLGASPNAAHHALVALEARFGDDMYLVTQNIDDLHERAGTRRVIHMHGEILRGRCPPCNTTFDQREDMRTDVACPSCGRSGLRPDIVWFGEVPMHMDEIAAALDACELFVSIGTSGTVYPAAGFGALAQAAGARTLELNLDASEGASAFDEVRIGPATQLVPGWVSEVLSR